MAHEVITNNKTIINEKEINYIKKDGMKLIFCTGNGNYETYSSFNKIESCLPENFVRCHKSYIANTDSIQNINNNTIFFIHSQWIFYLKFLELYQNLLYL